MIVHVMYILYNATNVEIGAAQMQNPSNRGVYAQERRRRRLNGSISWEHKGSGNWNTGRYTPVSKPMYVYAVGMWRRPLESFKLQLEVSE